MWYEREKRCRDEDRHGYVELEGPLGAHIKTAVFLINITDVRSDVSQGHSLLLTERVP